MMLQVPQSLEWPCYLLKFSWPWRIQGVRGPPVLATASMMRLVRWQCAVLSISSPLSYLYIDYKMPKTFPGAFILSPLRSSCPRQEGHSQGPLWALHLWQVISFNFGLHWPCPRLYHYIIREDGQPMYLGHRNSVLYYNSSLPSWVWYDRKDNRSVAISISPEASLFLGFNTFLQCQLVKVDFFMMTKN